VVLDYESGTFTKRRCKNDEDSVANERLTFSYRKIAVALKSLFSIRLCLVIEARDWHPNTVQICLQFSCVFQFFCLLG
jgi:hypothetical protein